MRKALIGALAGIALLLIIACGGTAEEKTSATPAATGQAAAAVKASEPAKANTFNQPIGTTIIAAGPEGTTEVTVTAAKRQKTACKPNSFNRPETGWYVVIDVTVKVTSGTAPINPLYFSYVDAGNSEVAGAIFASCKDLGSGSDFPAGTVRSGQLAYDVAAGPGTLTWSGVLGGQRGSWVIPA